ncbi:kinesin-like protein KIN-7C [Olea europaea var. sylvestris]|uniref:kinesin-like protein KIN-7C n=1 Tax=Olea europaea var. sylvestris TaxID=158386 RepID=UPI000C1CEF07|nr:kinesin-like protein KIN-7C [Olea europaea var. sylvestris]
MGTTDCGNEVMPGSGGHEEKIFVSVRLRPLNTKEILRNDISDWECINDDTIIYKNANLSASERSMYPTAYTFDRVFRSDCSTRQVYEQAAKDVALSVVSGMNSSVFAYGQTSSGKTYTMTGITEYAIADIYEYMQKHTEREFVLKFSAMEIYNESVRDLLSADCIPLRLLDDPERGTTVEKLTEEILRNWDHVIELLSVCEAQRHIGETSLNEMSSRSHQIIRLTIESSSHGVFGKDSSSILSATVNFVDLAGSERASQSLSEGTRLKEGCHINRSLLTLGTVIRKLSKGQNGHIPYRDSKLTRILQTSLAVNARTAIICTLSPARIHVEQSRNTLLFASCAKEVTTNAQVNLVMSDKALVKHLQRELARLESELRSPQSSLSTLSYPALLQEKDLQIEKLEKDVKELILQRDIAQTQVKDLLEMIGDDGNSMIRVGLGHYPHLRVQKSPEYEIPEQETSIGADPRSLDIDIGSDDHSRTSSDDHFAQVPYFEENFVNRNISPRLVISSSNFSESDSIQGWEEMEKQSNELSDDLCKEVRCIEIEESSNEGVVEPYCLPSEENIRFPALRIHGNVDVLEPEPESVLTTPAKDEELLSSQLKENVQMNRGSDHSPFLEDKEPVLASLEDDKESVSSSFKEERELKCLPFLEVSSLAHDLAKDSSGSRSLKLTKSRSCKASMLIESSSSWLKMIQYCETTPPDGSEREYTSRPVGFERKISPLNFGSNSQRSSPEDSQSSAKNAFDIVIGVSKGKVSAAEDVSVNYTCYTEIREKAELPIEKELAEIPTEKEVPENPEERELKANQTSKSVKDVGLDPIEEDEHKVFSNNWPMDFKRLQKEIIECWHACNVSLVHRTYFFLLFQGDPSDSIYLEVELRRMMFLKDKFSRGENTVVNGRRLSLASSVKGLRQERRMLSNQMLKKLSEQERDSLFIKWGIGINTKLRRLQLAHRVWTNTDDMNHVADSAFLVAKLVGFTEPGVATKEMFGLNFTPPSTRTYSFKRSLVSLL